MVARTGIIFECQINNAMAMIFIMNLNSEKNIGQNEPICTNLYEKGRRASNEQSKKKYDTIKEKLVSVGSLLIHSLDVKIFSIATELRASFN